MQSKYDIVEWLLVAVFVVVFLFALVAVVTGNYPGGM